MWLVLPICTLYAVRAVQCSCVGLHSELSDTLRCLAACMIFSLALRTASMCQLFALRAFYWKYKGTSRLKIGHRFPQPHKTEGRTLLLNISTCFSLESFKEKGVALNSSRQVVGSCECGNETSGSVKCEELLD